MMGLAPPTPLLLLLVLLLPGNMNLNGANAFGLEAFDLVHHVHTVHTLPLSLPSSSSLPWMEAQTAGDIWASASTSSSQSLATADLFLDGNFATESASPTQSPANLWTLRIGSALVTYFGFVAVNDRPRGYLAVPLETDSPQQQQGCLCVQPSTVPGAGLGLFVTQDLPKGTVLGTYAGVILPLQQHSASSKLRDHPGCLTYIWRFTDNQFVIDPTSSEDGSLPDFCKGGNPSQPLSVAFFGFLQTLGILPKTSTALCRINEPPIGRDVNVVTTEDLVERTVTFRLERNVLAGEELHIDYGLTYDRTGYSA